MDKVVYTIDVYQSDLDRMEKLLEKANNVYKQITQILDTMKNDNGTVEGQTKDTN